MSTIPQPLFYVYVLVRPDGRAFYVGKGQGKRIYDHDTEARGGIGAISAMSFGKYGSKGRTFSATQCSQLAMKPRLLTMNAN